MKTYWACRKPSARRWWTHRQAEINGRDATIFGAVGKLCTHKTVRHANVQEGHRGWGIELQLYLSLGMTSVLYLHLRRIWWCLPWTEAVSEVSVTDGRLRLDGGLEQKGWRWKWRRLVNKGRRTSDEWEAMETEAALQIPLRPSRQTDFEKLCF